MEISKEAMNFLNLEKADYIRIVSNISSNRVASCCIDSVTPKLDLVVDFGKGKLDESKYYVENFENKKIYIGLKAYERFGNNFNIILQKKLFSKKLVVENFEKIDLSGADEIN